VTLSIIGVGTTGIAITGISFIPQFLPPKVIRDLPPPPWA
jgi:hypothetical protein